VTGDVEWTFPLDFVEVVWVMASAPVGRSSRRPRCPASGQRHFEIPFDATGKKWVRFAAWDIAGNGALVQPIKLNSAQTSTR
jgi:hypothetical protein